jgi:ABC-type glycerol-3-phosphate transport system permease component
LKNEGFDAMVFIRDSMRVPLQLVLRSIVIEATFRKGMKMAAVIVAVVPIMCVFPFLQKHFVKGILIGAIKT